MKQTTYADLFEDEVAEILRTIPFAITVIMDAHHEFYPAGMICEDGIYTSGEGMYTEYLDGKKTGSHVSRKYLIDTLAHRPFSVIIK